MGSRIRAFSAQRL